MYMQDGKPLEIPHGRKSNPVSRSEYEALERRLSALETMFNGEADKPKRSRAVKEE